MQRLIILFIILSFLGSFKNIYSEDKMQIEIISFGQTENFVLDYLKENLSKIFKAEVSVGKTQDLPAYAYNKKRKQYLASAILDNLNKPQSHTQKILGLIEPDLYVPDLNFVFGLADPPKGVCIITLGRLHQSTYGLAEDKDLFLKRTLKEAVHEIGHLINLSHCPDPGCVMHFSNCLLDTDRKDYNFCANCKKHLPLKWQ